jgi:hypothetical protein
MVKKQGVKKTYGEWIVPVLKGVIDTNKKNKEERQWEKWVRLTPHIGVGSATLLQEVLGEPVFRAPFLARAIVVLLAPNLASLPFYWDKPDDNYAWAWKRDETVKKIPKELIRFTAELISKSMEYTGPSGESYTLYQTLVPDLLAVLAQNEKVAARLFAQYNLVGHKDAMADLLRDFRIPLRWKKLVDKEVQHRVREAIKHDQKGWLDLLRYYANNLSVVAKDFPRKNRSSYKHAGPKVRFVLKMMQMKKVQVPVFTTHEACFLINDLEGEKFRDLRHELGREVTLRRSDDSSSDYRRIWHPWPGRYDSCAIESLLKDFRAVDKELANGLTDILAEKERDEKNAPKRQEERKQREEREKAALRTLEAQMKK